MVIALLKVVVKRKIPVFVARDLDLVIHFEALLANVI
jgi:hypothetical protein